MPLIALTLLHLWRALGEERPRYWFAVGVELGLLVLTTYAGLIHVALAAVFVAATRRGRAKLGTVGPWAAAMIVVLIVFPHLIWLERTATNPLANLPGLAGLMRGEGHFVAWLSLLGWLISVHAGLAILLLVAGGLRAGSGTAAPAFEREPLPQFARTFVYYFALAPAFVATAWAVIFATTLPFGGTGPLVVLSGLAVVVAAGDVIHLYRQRIVGLAWLALLLTPPALTIAAVVLAPWTVAADLETGRPAAAMADFFTDSFHRRTGKPLRVVVGEVDTAGLVALGSADRPSLSLAANPALTPWVSEQDIRQRGAVVVWPSADTAGAPPPAIRQRFPDLVPEVPRSFERPIQGRLPLMRLGWGLIRPAGESSPAAVR
jgi:hypothetical protein